MTEKVVTGCAVHAAIRGSYCLYFLEMHKAVDYSCVPGPFGFLTNSLCKLDQAILTTCSMY